MLPTQHGMHCRSTGLVWLFVAVLFFAFSGCGGGDEVSEADSDHADVAPQSPNDTPDSPSTSEHVDQDLPDNDPDDSNDVTDLNQNNSSSTDNDEASSNSDDEIATGNSNDDPSNSSDTSNNNDTSENNNDASANVNDTSSSETTDHRSGTWAEIDLSDLSTLLGKNMSDLTPPQRAQVATAVQNADVDFAMTVDEFKASIPNFEAGEKYTGKVVELTGVVASFSRRTHVDDEYDPHVRFGLRCMEINDTNRFNSSLECHPIDLVPWLDVLPTQEITVRGVCYASSAQILNAAIVVDKKEVDLPRYDANELFTAYAKDPTGRYEHFSEAPAFILTGTVATVREDKEAFMLVTDAEIEHEIHGGGNDAAFNIEPGDEIEAVCHFTKFISDETNFVIATAFLLSIQGEPVID